MLRMLVTIYAIYLYNRLYPSKMSIGNLILLCIFPAFFIAGTAAINLDYLNPFREGTVDDYDYENFMEDLQHLDNINLRFFFIFIPIYLLLTYLLYYRSVSIIIQKGDLRAGILSIIRDKKEDIKRNKLYYLIVAVLSRYRFSFAKSTLGKVFR
jgi:hypothetical protein